MGEISSDRRRSRRAALKLPGRYMLSDGFEFHCRTLNVSATGVCIQADFVANLGERVVAYIDELGRIEGQVVRRGQDWFVIEVRTTQSRIDRIAQKIAALSGESPEALTVAPTETKRRSVRLQLGFGQIHIVEISDETSLGAKVHADFQLLPGVKLTIDGKPAVVDRDDSDGFFVAFARRSF